MAEIEFDDVNKRYADGFETVRHFNLDVHDGELMLLVGPSGSEYYAYFDVRSDLVSARELWFAPRHLQLFEPDTGRSLLVATQRRIAGAEVRAAA
jgi:ABC-type uncharacterized transport system ATPase subunit